MMMMMMIVVCGGSGCERDLFVRIGIKSRLECGLYIAIHSYIVVCKAT